MNPVEEFFAEYGREKRAFGMSNRFGGAFGSALAQGAGATLAATAVAGASVAASKLWGAATKQRNFRSMMEANPDLQEYHDRDPKSFNNMFSSLTRFNGEFASDPVVAGTYMRRMAENPLSAGGIISEGINMGDKLPKPFEDAARFGTQEAARGFSEQFHKQHISEKIEEAEKLDDIKSRLRAKYMNRTDPNASLRDELEGRQLRGRAAMMDHQVAAARARANGLHAPPLPPELAPFAGPQKPRRPLPWKSTAQSSAWMAAALPTSSRCSTAPQTLFSRRQQPLLFCRRCASTSRVFGQKMIVSGC